MKQKSHERSTTFDVMGKKYDGTLIIRFLHNYNISLLYINNTHMINVIIDSYLKHQCMFYSVGNLDLLFGKQIE